VRRITAALVAFAALFQSCFAGRAAAQQPLTPEQLEKLHQVIRPTADEEKWLQVPWMASVWEARRKAAALGKPILLWEMDGHPLGCT
jgi:hypothetical protein